MAADSEDPRSTSMRTCVMTFPRTLLSVWEPRIDRARRMGRPEFTIVANWREKIAMYFGLTWPGRRLISMDMPSRFLATLTGV